MQNRLLCNCSWKLNVKMFSWELVSVCIPVGQKETSILEALLSKAPSSLTPVMDTFLRVSREVILWNFSKHQSFQVKTFIYVQNITFSSVYLAKDAYLPLQFWDDSYREAFPKIHSRRTLERPIFNLRLVFPSNSSIIFTVIEAISCPTSTLWSRILLFFR